MDRKIAQLVELNCRAYRLFSGPIEPPTTTGR